MKVERVLSLHMWVPMLAAVMGLAGNARAESFTYDSVRTVRCLTCGSDQLMGVVTVITVDQLGTLTADGVTDWSITLAPDTTEYILSPANSTFTLQSGATMAATASSLTITMPMPGAGFSFSNSDSTVTWSIFDSRPGEVAIVNVNGAGKFGFNLATQQPEIFTANTLSQTGPPAVAPEPSSVLLLGTGVIGVIALLRLKRRS